MNFNDLYKKIRSIDEAGPAMMDPNAMMQQQMANMMKNNPAMQKLDPNVMMQQQQQRMQQMRQQNKQAQAAAPAGQEVYTVNGKPVSKAEYDTFMAQNPGLKPPALPATPALPAAPARPAVAAAPKPGQDDDWEESIESEEALAETMVDECGPMMGPSEQPKQQDSVTMSVNMNGNGSGGIRDLMNILKNIEHAAEPLNPHPHNVDKLFGDSYENSEQGGADEVTLNVADITPTGNDLSSKGHEAPKVNGGGNPMQEALVGRLTQMYQTIKEA